MPVIVNDTLNDDDAHRGDDMEFVVMVFDAVGVYSQKSVLRFPPPVPIYPFVPIENPTAPFLVLMKFVFCVHKLVV